MRTLCDACHGVACPPSACNPGHFSNIEKKWHHAKVLLKRYHLNGDTIGFCQQTQKLELHYLTNKEAPTVLCSVVKHAGSG